MTLTLDPRIALDAARTIKLGGLEFHIAPLVLRQTSIIMPMIPSVLRILNRRTHIADEFRASHETLDTDAPLSVEDAATLGEKLTLSKDEIDTALDVIRAGMSRAYPQVLLDDLYEMPIKINEIIAALAVVISQTQMVEKKDPQSSGEVAATALPSIG